MAKQLIVSSGNNEPERIVIYGPGGVGKSTLLGDMPEPLVLDVEGGAGKVEKLKKRRYVIEANPERTQFKKLEEFDEALESVYEYGSAYKTLGVDGIDNLDNLVHDWLVRQNPKWKTIQTPGFGAGEAATLQVWRRIITRLNDIRAKHGMRIVLLGHSKVDTFKNPEGSVYDRYQLNVTSHKLGDVAGYLFVWSDIFGFARYEPMLKEEGKRTIGVGQQGAHILHLQRMDSYDAKFRGDLGAPARIPLSWAELEKVIASSAQSAAEVVAEIQSLMSEFEKVDAEAAAKTAAWLPNNSKDVGLLVQMLDKIKGKLLLTTAA